MTGKDRLASHAELRRRIERCQRLADELDEGLPAPDVFVSGLRAELTALRAALDADERYLLSAAATGSRRRSSSRASSS